MSLNNIKLPGFIIQDLFQKNLVDISSVNTVKTAVSKPAISFSGSNNQQIIILVENPDEEFISAEQQIFLNGILNACKLTMSDVALINLTATTLHYQTIIKEFSPKIFLLFGVSPAAIQLPFVIPEFQKQMHNNIFYLSAPSLTELQNNKELKRKLWDLLKQLFSL